MGCVASRLEDEEEVVSICRERKNLIKLAVERRYALANAHCRYCQSLYAVSAAIKLFVARHSCRSSPFLITLPSSCPSPTPSDHQNVITNPMFLQQRPSESTKETIKCESCGASTTSSDSSEEDARDEEEQKQEEHYRMVKEEQEQAQQACGYFYMQMPPPMPSPHRDFGWDFFNPFDGMRPEAVRSYQRSCGDEFRVVREQEGIPELEVEGEREEEEEEEKKVVLVEENGTSGNENEVNGGDVLKVADGSNMASQTEHKRLTVIGTPEDGRELLDALKDIEDHFIRAYDSGKDVSRMLEANMSRLQSGMEEIKENSTKLIQAITWYRSTSSKPSSCKSLVASSSKGSSTWSEYSNDLFDDYGGMTSGSHSLTLGRLYAWEKKLYEEVKAGDTTRKLYEKKCSRLRNKDVKGYSELNIDRTRAAVKDLYARILVAIRSAESMSKRIEQLRDEELHPQIIELLKGLTRTWKIMLELHKTQNKILYEVKSFACPSHGKFSNDSHRLATLQLEAELQNWRECFTEYISAQKGYIQALCGWLTKFLVPGIELYSEGRSTGPTFRTDGPALLVICNKWLASLERLPDKGVAFALKSFSKDVRALWSQQGEEQHQKRKVDSLAKELDRRTLAFQRAETRLLESKSSEQKSEAEVETQNEFLREKKEHLGLLHKRLEVEREKHNNCMQETQRIMLNGFQTGFGNVLESLTEFSKSSLNMYNDLVNYSENAGTTSQSYIGGPQAEEYGSR